MLPPQSTDVKPRANEVQRSNVIQVVRSSATPHAGAIPPSSFPAFPLGCDATSPTHLSDACATHAVARTWPYAASSPQIFAHAQHELASRAPPVEAAIPADAIVMMEMEPGGLNDMSMQQLSFLQSPSLQLSNGFNGLELDDTPASAFDLAPGAHLAANSAQYAHLGGGGGEQAAMLAEIDPLGGVGGQGVFFKHEGDMIDPQLQLGPLLVSTAHEALASDFLASPLAPADMFFSPSYTYPLSFDADFANQGATVFVSQASEVEQQQLVMAGDGVGVGVGVMSHMPQEQQTLVFTNRPTSATANVNGTQMPMPMQVQVQTTGAAEATAAATTTSALVVTGRRYPTRQSGRLMQSAAGAGGATGSPSVGGSLSSHATSVSGVRHSIHMHSIPYAMPFRERMRSLAMSTVIPNA